MKRIVLTAGACALLLAACGGGGDGATTTTAAPNQAGSVTASATNGEALYSATCVACHGQAGAGIEGLGKPLAGSAFVSGLDDAALVAFIKVGRDTSDPENTSGVSMPPKGGNPALSDGDLEDIVAYLRTLN